MKNQQVIAGEHLIGQEARRAAFLARNAEIAEKSDKEWWRDVLQSHRDGTCEECKRMKESRAK